MYYSSAAGEKRIRKSTLRVKFHEIKKDLARKGVTIIAHHLEKRLFFA